MPVVHDGDIFHTPITEIRVDYKDQWVKKAWRAIESAYSTSAYFEYYKDDIYAILSSGIPTLWDLNLRIIEFFIQKIRLGIRIVPTESYASAGNALDYRNVIHPKKQNTILKDLDMEKPYFQVFAGKYGFQSDLSVMDLLFNEGPQSLLYLVPSLD